jgi:signal transduction histidine kinase
VNASRWIVGVGAGWLVQFVILLWLPPHGTARFVVDCLGWIAIGLLGAVLARQRARRELEAATGWGLVSAGLLLMVIVSAGDAVLVVIYGRLPLPPAIIAIMDDSTWVVLLAGLLSWTGRGYKSGATTRAALDATLFGASVFLLAWWVHLAELTSLSEVSLFRAIRSALPFALSSIGLGVVAFLAARSTERLKGPLGWFGVAYLMLLAGGLAYAWATMRGFFYLGHPLDALLQLPLFAVAMAPASRHRLPPAIEADDPGNTLGDVLTNLPAAIALVVAAVQSLAGARLDMLSRAVCISIVALLLVRQVLALLDVRRLSRTLEDRVAERTRELAASQMALARAQRMEAIGRLAGGVAHDFNNVLSAISGHAELLCDELDSQHPAQESTAAIREAAHSGSELAKRLLSFARPVALSPRPVTASEAVARAGQLTRGLARGRVDVQLRVSAADSTVFIDPVLLDQVLTNLTSNAVDAMPDGGTVTLEAEAVVLTSPTGVLAVSPGRYVRFSVTDTGSGMDEVTQSHIFEPFFTTKSGDRGTGLGLPTAYSIVNQAGGSISVHSRSGVGTRFEVLLREADGPVARPSGSASSGL